jgi:cytosine deaminase
MPSPLANLALPASGRYVLANATVPRDLAPEAVGDAREGLVTVDILISGGLIEAVFPKGGAPDGVTVIDLDGGMVWPCFVDMHTHLDKGHIWERKPNPDGTFMGALDAVHDDREARWSADDVALRMGFSLRTAFAHGTRLIRTHLDSLAPQHRISFEVFQTLRAEWKGRIDLQAAALFPLDLVDDTAFFRDLVTVVKESGGLMGGVTFPNPGLEGQLETLFRAAEEIGVDIDLHVDETADASVLTLKSIAEAKLRTGFSGTVTVGHICSLARQDDDTAARIVDLVAKADLAVVSLPMCNMYLQDRHAGRTPIWRGVTLFQELRAAGVRTAVSSDNIRDPFYAYGDLDPVEVFREAVRILHLDHPLDHAAPVITSTPAAILKRSDLGLIRSGAGADLVLFSARRWSELLSRPQADRTVLRAGRPIDRTLPDYRELDTLTGG